MENPEIRTLLELRKKLDEELEELANTIERLRSYIGVLDTIIGKGSFATAEDALSAVSEEEAGTTQAEGPTPSTMPEETRITPVQNKAGDLELATIEVMGQDLRILPASHASYDIKRGAFARFFVERILGQFQQEDRRRVENSELGWEEAFDFEVRADEGILQEILIRNYATEERLTEIQRTLRWALEKTYRPR